jgi:hypothetical protein
MLVYIAKVRVIMQNVAYCKVIIMREQGFCFHVAEVRVIKKVIPVVVFILKKVRVIM